MCHFKIVTLLALALMFLYFRAYLVQLNGRKQAVLEGHVVCEFEAAVVWQLCGLLYFVDGPDVLEFVFVYDAFECE